MVDIALQKRDIWLYIHMARWLMVDIALQRRGIWLYIQMAIWLMVDIAIQKVYIPQTKEARLGWGSYLLSIRITFVHQDLLSRPTCLDLPRLA